MFLRSYERGERVHLAMMSRGFTGTIPDMPGVATSPRATSAQWTLVLLPAAAAVAVAAAAWSLS